MDSQTTNTTEINDNFIQLSFNFGVVHHRFCRKLITNYGSRQGPARIVLAKFQQSFSWPKIDYITGHDCDQHRRHSHPRRIGSLQTSTKSTLSSPPVAGWYFVIIIQPGISHFRLHPARKFHANGTLYTEGKQHLHTHTHTHWLNIPESPKWKLDNSMVHVLSWGVHAG